MNTNTLFDFDEPNEIASWSPINDVVMGGTSTGSMIQGAPGIAFFIGRVSFENNGGFASVRSSTIPSSLNGFAGIEMRVQGDGKKYKLRLRTSAEPNGFCYEISFTANAGNWEELRFPFEQAKAKFRGITIPFFPALKSMEIQSIGLLISDKQEGAFRLDIDWIKAYGS